MAQPGRNDPCPCGSGKKYKKCCLNLAVDTPLESPGPWQAKPASESSHPGIDALFSQGFARDREGDQAAACLAFAEGWRRIRAHLTPTMDTLARMTAAYDGIYYREDLLHEHLRLLRNYTLDNPAVAVDGVEISTFILKQFCGESEHFKENIRAYLGEFHYWSGDPAKGEEVLRGLITDLPHRSVGYAHLAEALGETVFPWHDGKLLDPRGALATLEAAFSYPVEDAAEYDMEWRLEEMRKVVAGLCE